MLFFKQWPVSYNTPYEKIGDEVRSLADEVPFDIPDSWEWVQLGELFQHNTGKALNAANRTGQLKQYITTSNLYWNRFELDNLKEMHFSESEVEKCTVIKGDLLVCEGGDIGRAAIWSYDYPMCIQNHIHRLRAYVPLCTRFFYYLFDLYKHAGWIGGKGIGIQGLSSNAIHSLLFPLPPLAEQYRIVDAIVTLQPYTDAYADVESTLDILNTAFPERLKKSILQEAVQGKLVPQEPSDEPAEALLERIRAEKQRLVKEGKIKKDKHESVIFRRDNSHYEQCGLDMVCIDDQLPFQIPDTWQWERLINIYNFIDYRGATPNKTAKGVPLITAKNVKKGFIDYTVSEFISENEYQNRQSRGVSQEGDILFTTEAPMGNAALANLPIYSAGQRLITFQQYGVHKGLSNELMLYFILSDSFQRQLSDQSTGTTVKGIKAEKLKQLYIPVPPEDEQQRIIHAIRAAFRLVTAL